jgi:putative transposase
MAKERRQSMKEYRRFHHSKTTRFFTVNLVERHGNRLLTDHVDGLMAAFLHVKRKHHFTIDNGVDISDRATGE